ncbi:MAG: hypothetical protein RR235_05885 [Oscillospiraceae bacterium]
MTDSEAVNKYRKKKNKKRLILIIAAVLLAAAAVGVIIGLRIIKAKDHESAPIVEGQLSEQEIAGKLQEQVDSGMFNCEINPAPTFETGDSAGLLAIRNATANNKDMLVTITLDDTGETVYKSKVLKPGEQIMRDSLSVKLPQGKYPATALVTVLKPSTEDDVAKLKMALNIIIKK